MQIEKEKITKDLLENNEEYVKMCTTIVCNNIKN